MGLSQLQTKIAELESEYENMKGVSTNTSAIKEALVDSRLSLLQELVEARKEYADLLNEL